MNLFGLSVKLARNNKNNKYITHEICKSNQETIIRHIDQRIDDVIHHQDSRFNDFKDFIIKNGR